MFAVLLTTVLSTCLCATPPGAKKDAPTLERPVVSIPAFSQSLADLAKASGKNPEDYRHFDKESVHTVISGKKTYAVAIQSNVPLTIPGVSMQQIVLLTPGGKILDRLQCEINSRYGRTETEIPAEPFADGAQVVIRFVGSAFPTGAPTLCHNWHAIRFRDRFWTFWTRSREGGERPTKWNERGLCRIAIADDKLLVLFPKLEMPELGKAKSLTLRYRVDDTDRQLTIDDPKQVAEILSKVNVVGSDQEGGAGAQHSHTTIDFVMPDGVTLSMGILSSRIFAGGEEIGLIHLETDSFYKALRQTVFEAEGTMINLSNEAEREQKKEDSKEYGKEGKIKLN